MKIHILYLLSIPFIINSCKDVHKNKNEQIHDSVKIKIADNYYQIDSFLKAKLYYDTLLLSDSLNAEFYFRRAFCESFMLDTKGAIFNYRKAIGHNYKNLKSAYLNLGINYRVLNKLDSAIYFYNKCLYIDPQNNKAKIEKKEVLYKLNELR